MSLFVTGNDALLVVEDDQPSLVIQEDASFLSVIEPDGSLSVTETRPLLYVDAEVGSLVVSEPEPAFLVSEGSQGPRGPQGPAGPSGSAAVELTAGEPLGGHRAVYADSGEAFIADNSTLAHVGRVAGITTGASSAGATATIQFTGEMTESSWAWNPGPIYVGANGVLTQTKPTSGWVVAIGTALSSDTIMIHRTASIVRA